MNINELKEKFETGDFPNENDFANLIDHCYNSGITSGETYIAGNNIIFDTHIPNKTIIINNISKLEDINNVNVLNINNNQILIRNENNWVNSYLYEQINYNVLLNSGNTTLTIISNNFTPYQIDTISLFSSGSTFNATMIVNNNYIVDGVNNILINSIKNIIQPNDSYILENEDLKININNITSNSKLYCTIKLKMIPIDYPNRIN
jgi:hypothetical protein